jgi:uncharacterized protein YfaS (alpha-2-macroglobulin family)
MSTATTGSGPAGSRRFWVTVLCFAVANLGIWIAYDRLVRNGRHALLEVRQSEPSTGWEVGGRPNFWWTFNLDVAPAKPGDPPPGTISPAVPGKWAWDGPRSLNFMPDAPLPKATTFTVTLLPERLQTPEGFRLKFPHVTSVHTAPLAVTAISQAAFDERDRLVLEINFNDDVLPADVLAHLSLRDFNGKPVAFHPHGDAIGHVVRVLTDPIPAAPAAEHDPRIFVRVTSGVAGRSGPMGLASEYEGSLQIASGLAATGARVAYSNDYAPVIYLNFNNPVDRQALAPLLSVDPKIPYTLNSSYGDNSVELRGDFAPATRYAIRIAKAQGGLARDKTPRAETLSVFVPDRNPSLRFEHEEGYLGSGGNRTVLAHAVNLTRVHATVTRIYDNNLVIWRNTRVDGASLDRPVATKDLKLPSLKNKTQDLRLSLDDLLPADAPRDGVYMLRIEAGSSSEPAAETEGRFADSAMLTLSDIGLTAKQGRTAVTVWATSLRTAEPLGGVRVRLFSNKNQRLGRATTGADGLATIAIAPGAEGEEPAVILADRPNAPADQTPATASASSARDLTWLDLRSSKINFGETDTAGDAYLRNGHEAFIYTDRGVYRPGETVHLRAIVRGPDGITPPSFPIRWQFRRPDLHDWKGVVGQLDADGAASLDLSLPDDLPTGQWSVTLGLPGDRKESESFGSASFQVEEFMPSRMQVGLMLKGDAALGAGAGDRGELNGSTPRFFLKDGTLSAEVQADYLFGKPVSERPARIVARIDPTPFAPPQWIGWTFGDSASVAQTLENLKVTGHRTELPEQLLDAKGHAAFDLDLAELLSGDESGPAHATKHRKSRRGSTVTVEPPPQSGAHYVGPWLLTLVASVIETGGRAVSATRTAELDPLPWYIAVRPRSTSTLPGAPNSFDVSLVAPSGQVVSDNAELEAEVYREAWNNSLAYENSHYVYHATRLLEPVRQKGVIKVAGGKGTLDVTPGGFGSYVLCLRDPKTGGTTSLGFYSGQGAWEDNISRENPEKLELLVQPLPRADQFRRAVSQLGAGFRSEAALLVARASRPWEQPRMGGTPMPPAALPIAPELADGIASFRALATHPKNAKFRTDDTAQVIVRSPFAGRLLLSVETDDVVTTKVIEMPASHVSVPIIFNKACRPNAYVTATVIRAIDPDAAWQTHRATGTLRVPLSNDDRKLTVEVSAPQSIRPATSLGVDVRVMDGSGSPVVNAALTVAAVDEGICQLTGFTAPDPFGFFTRIRALGVGTADLYGQLMPEVPKADKVSAVGGDKDAYDPRHLSPVSAKRVKPVALMSAVLHTDEMGMAHADFGVPRFTGKLRLMVVTSQGARFGSGQTATLVRSPLLVQSSWPRFAAPGDRFLVPLTVFNNTPADMNASMTLHVGDGPLRFGASADASLPIVKLSADGQATEFVEVTASRDSGVSHVSLIASAGNETYEEDVEIPVRPASPEIQLGGYAVATAEKPAEIVLPGGMLKGTERFQIKVTPWPSLELPRGLDYLDRYPYGCLEQTTSTLFPLAYLSDIGQQIAPGLFEKDRIDGKVQAGITRLIGMQTTNGGLAMWPGYNEPWPWGTVYAAHFLIEAHNAGHVVPEELRKSVLGYVRGLLNVSSDESETLETQAYACYVLALAGKPERAVMSRLSEIVNAPRSDGIEVSGQARLHLAAAWLAAGRRDLAEGLIPQVLPSPRGKRSLSGSLGSPVRDRAILVDTLLAVQPDHPALPALVQQLADSGRAGQWRSTQDTAFAVLALGRYLRQNQKVTPYETAALRDGTTLIEQATSGKPLMWDAGSNGHPIPGDLTTFRIEIAGPAGAKAHVSWLQSGVPLAPQPAADHGMRIRRRLLDERGKPLAADRVRSGDLVQVELSIASETPLEYIAIDDLLPAGLEIENPRLLTTATAETEPPKEGQSPDRFQDSRVDMRDDRLIVIGHLTSAGTGTYVYTARAVTPGKFILPPAHAECMYDMGTNSLSEGGLFEVLSEQPARIANVRDDANDR